MAGFFGMFDHTKVGKGVDKDAPQKKRIFLFFELLARKWSQLVFLSLLYFVMCIPVVTIGAATAGFFYVLRNMSQEKPVFLVSDFFDAFKKNWKQATVFLVISVLLFGVLMYAIVYWSSMTANGFIFYIPYAVCLSALIVLLFTQYYVYLEIVTLDLKLKAMIKNGVILSFAALKTNIITTFFLALTIIGTVFLVFSFLPAIILIPLFLFSFCGFIISFNSYQYITKYITDPYYQKLAETQPPAEKEEEEPIFTDIGTKEVRAMSKKEVKTKGKKIT